MLKCLMSIRSFPLPPIIKLLINDIRTKDLPTVEKLAGITLSTWYHCSERKWTSHSSPYTALGMDVTSTMCYQSTEHKSYFEERSKLPSGIFYERSLSSLKPKGQEKLRYSSWFKKKKLNWSKNQTHTIKNIIGD